ncbi:hypothetical protein LRAMOSA11295 [Lichtheimia ramosa]|uniref:Uncharacterized protein n=1 Tax=Lichtheimia ramosa TaxID=688394 RepID=A0A077WU36_9FUNG|nr:hypothetical protein LRAMOSA11295 [Lichtheimia ramosa]
MGDSICFLFGVVVPLVMGFPRPNSRLIKFPAASSNADCSAGVPLQAAREVSESTQVLTRPVVLANQQPWVAPVVPYKASNACEYPGMLFSTRTVEQVPRGNMSALEGDAVPSSSSSVDLFKKSKPVHSTRSQPKLLQGMAMHKAMQKLDAMAPRDITATTVTTTTTTTTTSASSFASTFRLPASASSSASKPSASIDELCEAPSNLDIDQDTDMPDVVPGNQELREIVENEDRAASERAQTPGVQEVDMASPSPSPPPPPPPPATAYTQMMPEQQQQQQQEQPVLYTQVIPPPAILYTQVIPQQPIIHPVPTPAVVVAAVAAAAIPVVPNTGSSTTITPLHISRPFLRPVSRLRRQVVQPPPPRPPPRPPSPPPRPPTRRLTILPPKTPPLPPQPPTPPACASSAMTMEATNRTIVRPVRRLQRRDVTLSKGTENTTLASASSSSAPSSSSSSSALPQASSSSSSSSIPSSASPSSSFVFIPTSSASTTSALPSLAEEQPAPPSSILREYAAGVDSFMGGDNILEEILADEEDPFDAYIIFDNDW